MKLTRRQFLLSTTAVVVAVGLPALGHTGQWKQYTATVSEVACHCVAQYGPNPDCGTCGGDGTVHAIQIMDPTEEQPHE